MPESTPLTAAAKVCSKCGEAKACNAETAFLKAQLADRTKRLAALRDQVESGGCAAAHLGETSLECDATKPCGLCRLNSQLAKGRDHIRELRAQIEERNITIAIEHGLTTEARGIAREALDALRATDDARRGYGLLLLARFDALHWPKDDR